ncbi:unnamed protein product [Boreogadus saida]
MLEQHLHGIQQLQACHLGGGEEQPDIHIRVTTGSQETGKEETFPPQRGTAILVTAAVLRLNSSMETRMTDGLAEVLSRWAVLTSGVQRPTAPL